MTHDVFPIEMFFCIIVEILLILETKLQSGQVLTNKLMELKMSSSSLWAGVSTRWYLRLVYCDSSSQNFGSGVNVHVSANVVWEWADWELGVDSNDGLLTNWKKQIDCISKFVLCKCSIAKSVRINFGTSDYGRSSGKSFDGGLVNKVNFLFELLFIESWNVANPFENVVEKLQVVNKYYKL